MAITIERLSREREQDMTIIKVATATYYVHGGKAYKRGAGDIPSGASLLVREGSPAVIERYGIEVRDEENVTRVPDAGRTPARDVGVGVSSLAEEGLRRIDVRRDIDRETAGIRAAAPGVAGTSRQAAMLREQLVEERLKGDAVDPSTQVIQPGTAAASAAAAQGGGIGGAPINEEITAALEQGERDATARHARAVMDSGQGEGGGANLREQETSSTATSTGEPGANQSGTTDGGGVKASTLSPATDSSSSVTREIAPEGDAAAKITAEADARRRAEEDAAQREAETRTPPATS